jgi:DNA-binding beta-propeller fold protein YncE
MTLTSAPPGAPDQVQAEALIKEARRHQQRRWWRRGAPVVAVALAVTVVLAWLQGGGPAKPHHQIIHPTSPTTRHVIGPSLGPATAYRLTGPIGVATDGARDVFFTDGNRVFEIDHADQQLVIVAGTGAYGFSGNGGPGPQATLSDPSGVAVAHDGDVYFVDSNRIREVSSATGIISTVAGTGRVGSGGNGGPAIRASLNLEDAAGGSVGLNDPLAFGPQGKLYIADGGNNEIRKVSLATGVITRVTGVCAPLGIAVDSSSDIFVATACGAVQEVSHSSGLISTIFSGSEDPALAGSAGDHDPVGLAVSHNGKLFVTEAYGRRLLEIDLHTGQVTLAAGTGAQTTPMAIETAGDGGLASQATFGLAVGVAVDHQGDVYVADFFNNAVRMINARTGVISTVAGRIPTSPAQGHCC